MLLNLCHHANGQGEAYPSVSLVARETGYSAKAVITAFGGLEACGIIRRVGACGDKKRVTVYSILGIEAHVHNLANGEVSAPLGGFNGEVSSGNGEVSSEREGSNGELSSGNGELSSGRSILGNNTSVSGLVSGDGNGEVSTPFVHKSDGGGSGAPSVAPSARNEYEELVRRPGWKPVTDMDRRACARLCFDLGANKEQATRFVRYNAIRRWTCCDYGCVLDAAKEWVAHWREDDPESFWAEANRRRAAC